MVKVHLNTLPLECREEIWMLALLPSPSVYRFDPARCKVSEGTDQFQDEIWMVSKHKYPTAMHVCQESRYLALKLIEREQKQEQENGVPPHYCIGSSTRPFNFYLDTFWLSHEDHLLHVCVNGVNSVVGHRIRTIQNLALSSSSIKSVVPGGLSISTWDMFRWERLGRYVSLQRVSVVIGETWLDWSGEDRSSCDSTPSGTRTPVLRLENWTEDLSSIHPLSEVRIKMDKVQSDICQGFQYMFERVQDEDCLEWDSAPEGSPPWQDGSKIKFHAAQILKTRAS